MVVSMLGVKSDVMLVQFENHVIAPANAPAVRYRDSGSEYIDQRQIGHFLRHH